VKAYKDFMNVISKIRLGAGASRPGKSPWRNMIILMNQEVLTVPEIVSAVGERMLEYHLHRLELAGLIELQEGEIVLIESGIAYGGLVRKELELDGADKI